MTDTATPSTPHNAERDKLNAQRLRLTAARERIDHAARLLAQGEDWRKVSACEELRRALLALGGEPEGD